MLDDRLIRTELSARPTEKGQAPGTGDTEKSSRFIFVEFNAWLYQGYDDARAALIEVGASTSAMEAEERKTGIDKAKDLLESEPFK